MSARRVSNVGHEIVGWPAAVQGKNRRRDNDANRGGANEGNPRTVFPITSLVGLVLPHVRSMRRVRQPDAIVRGLRAQGSLGLLIPSVDIALSRRREHSAMCREDPKWIIRFASIFRSSRD